MSEERDDIINFHELSIMDFNKELGSSSPAPGGGSTAALAGALACSLLGMVSKIALKNSKEPGVNIRLKELIENIENSQKRFMKLMNEDTAAFNEILNSFKLPKGIPEEQSHRTQAIQNATKLAAEVPLKTTRLAFDTLKLVKDLTELGSDNTISDTGVAGLMAYSALRGAIWNVKINLCSIKDSGYVQETNLEIEKIMESVNKLWPEIQRIVENKIIQ
jgi:formiminotetrahydrofolate cyclodeaminase